MVLSLCFVTWEDGHRRGMHFPPDRLIEALLAHPRTRRLLVVDPYRDRLRTYAKRALGRRLNPARSEDPERVRHLRPVRTSGLTDPVPVADLERLYRDWDARVALEAQTAGFERPVVITTNPFVAGFAPLRWASDVTYYVWDDWAAQPGYRPWWPAFRESYDRVRARGMRVCAVSEEILERTRPSGPHAARAERDRPGRMGRALPRSRLVHRPPRTAPPLRRAPWTRASTPTWWRPPRAGSRRDRWCSWARWPIPRTSSRSGHSRTSTCARAVPRDRDRRADRRRRRLPGPARANGADHGHEPAQALRVRGRGPAGGRRGPRRRCAGSARAWFSWARAATIPSAVAEALRIGPAPEDERRAFLAQNSWKRRHDDLIALALACRHRWARGPFRSRFPDVSPVPHRPLAVTSGRSR